MGGLERGAFAFRDWQIAREIRQRQQALGWGARVIERLSRDLRKALRRTREERRRRALVALATCLGKTWLAALDYGHRKARTLCLLHPSLGERWVWVLMKHEYTVVYQTVEDGWVIATVPELPGAVTQGRDLEEARANIKEAVELLLKAYRDNAAKDAPGSAIWETLTVDVPAA